VGYDGNIPLEGGEGVASRRWQVGKESGQSASQRDREGCGAQQQWASRSRPVTGKSSSVVRFRISPSTSCFAERALKSGGQLMPEPLTGGLMSVASRRGMTRLAYLPDTGDLIWTDFEPTKGGDQAGRRPAPVVSPAAFTENTGLAPSDPGAKNSAAVVALRLSLRTGRRFPRLRHRRRRPPPTAGARRRALLPPPSPW
jgi:hypothetical protein